MGEPAKEVAPKSMAVVRFEGEMFEQLLEIFADMHEESPVMSALPYDEERVNRVIAAALQNPQHIGGFACIDFASGSIVGLVIGTVGRAYFSNEVIATEVALYMRPEHRNEFVLKQLLDAYGSWAKRLEIKHVYLTNMSGLIPEKLGKVMAKSMGWKPIGQQMMKVAE